MSRAPKVLRVWQFHDEPQQPTCYDARNPAALWLPADELAYDDAQDRIEAQAWLKDGHGAASIREVQDPRGAPSSAETTYRRWPSPPTRAAVPNSISVLDQIGHALHALQKKP